MAHFPLFVFLFFFGVKADKKKKDGNTRRKKISDLEDNSEVKEDTTNTSSEETSKSDSKKASSEKKEIPQEYKVKKEQLPKASDFLEVIKKKIIKVKFTFEKICDKIKEIFSGYEKFKEFISSEETKETLRCLNTQRKYLFHHLKPDKSDLYLHFGTEDPATTGEVLALLSLVYPFYPWNLNVEPDFEQVCLDGKLKIKGKIQVYVLLITLWRLYQNENIKKFMKTVTQ